MTTRTKIAEDEATVTYEVTDDDGGVIGTDIEPKMRPDDPRQDVRRQVEQATTVAQLKAALLAFIDAT